MGVVAYILRVKYVRFVGRKNMAGFSTQGGPGSRYLFEIAQLCARLRSGQSASDILAELLYRAAEHRA